MSEAKTKVTKTVAPSPDKFKQLCTVFRAALLSLSVVVLRLRLMVSWVCLMVNSLVVDSIVVNGLDLCECVCVFVYFTWSPLLSCAANYPAGSRE